MDSKPPAPDSDAGASAAAGTPYVPSRRTAAAAEHGEQGADAATDGEPSGAGSWLLGSRDEAAFEHAQDERDDPLVGRTVDRYRILRLLGTGGMGKVYLAEHMHMHRRCAFKVMRSDVTTDPEFVTRFQREAQATARFTHPNAVAVYDFGRIGRNLFFMALEYVEGEPLDERIAREGALALRDVVEIALQVLDVLEAAHNAGIVHRDLKPENIMLRRVEDWPNQVKVLDFGIAKVAHAKGAVADFRTRLGEFFGTPEYASPEQCAGEAVDHRSDIYSFGVILYELLTGRKPFEAERPGLYLAMHMADPVPAMREANPAVRVPEAVEKVVRRALAKKPADRFPSARAFADALADAADYHPRFTVGDNGVRRIDERPARSGSRWGRALVAAAVLALAAFAWAPWRREATAPTPPASIAVTVDPAPTAHDPPATVRLLDASGVRRGVRTAGPDGRVRFGPLSPGRYTVEVALADGPPARREAVLEPGRSLEIVLRLDAAETEHSRAQRDEETERLRERAVALRAAVTTLASRLARLHMPAVATDTASVPPPVLPTGQLEHAQSLWTEGDAAFAAGDLATATGRLEAARALFESLLEQTERALRQQTEAAREAANKALAAARAAEAQRLAPSAWEEAVRATRRAERLDRDRPEALRERHTRWEQARIAAERAVQQARGQALSQARERIEALRQRVGALARTLRAWSTAIADAQLPPGALPPLPEDDLEAAEAARMQAEAALARGELATALDRFEAALALFETLRDEFGPALSSAAQAARQRSREALEAARKAEAERIAAAAWARAVSATARAERTESERPEALGAQVVAWQRARLAAEAAVRAARHQAGARKRREALVQQLAQLASLRKAAASARGAARAAGADTRATELFLEADRLRARALTRIGRVAGRLGDENPLGEPEFERAQADLEQAADMLRRAGLAYARATETARRAAALAWKASVYEDRRDEIEALRERWRTAHSEAQRAGRPVEAALATAQAAEQLIEQAGQLAERGDVQAYEAAIRSLERARGLLSRAIELAESANGDDNASR